MQPPTGRISSHRVGLLSKSKIEKTSHPAYALRRNFLIGALRRLGWLTPVATVSHRLIRKAEKAFISYVSGGDFGPWASVFTEPQISDAINVIRDHFDTTGTRIAKRPDEATLVALVKRISWHLPPIREEIDDAGVSTTFEIRLEEQLYAGWAYWIGRDVFKSEKLSFFQLNQLCDMALLHQQAIDLAAGRRAL